jgi:ATP-binding cassette subfamily B protein
MLRAAWRFRQFLRRFAPAFGLGAVLVGLSTLVDLAQPWPLKVIVDGAFLHRPQTGWLPALIAGPTPSPNVWTGTSWMITTPPQTIVVRAAIATALLAGLGALFDYSSNMLMDRAGEKVVVKLRRATYAHLQRLSISFHERQRVGDLVSRVTNDIDRVQSMLVSVFDTLIPSVVMLLGIAVVVLLLNPSFGLLALAIAPPLFFVTYWYTRRIRDAARRAREADAQVAAHANETLGAVRSVQAFTREDHEDHRFEEHNLESLAASLESVRLRAMFTPIVDIVSVAGTLIVTYFGAERVIHGKMSLGIFLVFLFYLRQLYRPMRALSKMTYVVSRGTTSAARVEEILRVDERIPQREDAIHVDRATGAIDLVDVTFRYRPDLPPVLEDATVHIAPGERIGIVGRTGAGKSTIASLIPRFYDPEAGAVLIDGVNVRDLELASLRQQVSIVLQEPVLFFGSILDNIRYGDVDAPMERVWECVEAAHVSEFLDRLPNGIDTTVSERGSTLSGGQRQRIAVARAMLADAPILILDEPTTGLDRKSEGLVLDGLERLSKGRTTIVISHHEPALRGVSRLIHVVDGHLVEGDVPTVETPAARTDSDLYELTLDAAADEVGEHTFSRAADGYAVHEVDGFLSRLSARLRTSSRRERALLAALEVRGLPVRSEEDLAAVEDPAGDVVSEEPAGRSRR